MIKLIQGDCLEKLQELEENSVDAIITDPPYELGFMGKSWDKTGIANNARMWRKCLRVLKPGGYLLSFGGTRTYHRMASAIEDAGFEVRDMIEWVYGSGFPKSLNIGKAVDKLQGNEREVLGEKVRGDVQKAKETGSTFAVADANKNNKNIFGYGIETLTKGTSEWEGWGTALKPAHEPICMARKPLSEKTVAENCLKYGTGGINIDESRVDLVGIEEHTTEGKSGLGNNVFGKYKNEQKEVTELPRYNEQGRFPANLCHDNSEEVRECFPETKSTPSSGHFRKGNVVGDNRTSKGAGQFGDGNWIVGSKHDDSGNASRFFKSIIYTTKASKKDRGIGNNHPTVKPVALIEYLINMVSKKDAVILDPFMGSGTTGVACKNLNRNFIGIELKPEYFKITEKRIY